MLVAMLSRLLFVTVLVAGIACGSKSKGTIRDTDGSPGREVQSETAVPAQPDVPVGADASSKDAGGVEMARDATVADAPTPADGPARDATPREGAAEVPSTDTAGLSDAARVMEVGRDSAPMSDALAAFCTGHLPRMATNGNSAGPAIRTYIDPISCCDVITFEFITATFLSPIFVSWTMPAGDPPSVDIDLSAPTRNVSVKVATECTSRTATCPDVYTSGFKGRLQVSLLDGGLGYDVNLCLHAEEPADSPHTSLHSFDLYLPHEIVR
jgi:hypothetical protein